MNRIEFHEKHGSLQPGDTKEHVRNLLGDPDEVVAPVQNDPTKPQFEKWRYGTTGPLSVSLLGDVWFTDGEIQFLDGDQRISPPALELISDAELFEKIRFLEEELVRDAHPYSPLFFIRVVNGLVPLGREKSLAVLLEFDRCWTRMRGESPLVMLYVLRVLFILKGSAPFFPLPSLGSYFPKPKDLRHWPEWPMVLMDDIPIQFGDLAVRDSSFGLAPYIRKHSGDWELRGAVLRPPDDPFAALNQAIEDGDQALHSGSVQLNRENVYGYESTENFWRMYQVLITKELTRLVAEPANPLRPLRQLKLLRTEEGRKQVHEDFLASGARWDESLRMYAIKEDSIKT